MSKDKEKYSKTDHGGASRRVGVCRGWRETHFVFVWKNLLIGLLFLILIFFFNLFNIQNAWLFLLNFTSLGWLCPFASLKAAEKAPVGEGDLPLPQPSFSD